MRTIYKMRTDKSRLRTEHTGVDLFQGLAAQIVIPVSRSPCKAGFRNAVFLKSIHHTLRIRFADLLQQGELRRGKCFSTAGQVNYFRSDL